MRVLLLGAGGMLARALRAEHPADVTIDARPHAELDVRDDEAVSRAVRETSPDWIVNASGYTDVDGAEDEPDVAYAVNDVAVGDLARIARERRAALLHFSTDYVFDGEKDGYYEETDAPRPLNVYGASKLAGEERIRATEVRHVIVRTQWLYGGTGRSFVSTLRERALSRTPTRAVNDQFGGCTYIVDLARIVWPALGRLDGTFHVANRGRVNRYMIAEMVFAIMGASEMLTAASRRDFAARAMRPKNSPLSVQKIEMALGIRMPDWSDALHRYLASQPSASA